MEASKIVAIIRKQCYELLDEQCYAHNVWGPKSPEAFCIGLVRKSLDEIADKIEAEAGGSSTSASTDVH